MRARRLDRRALRRHPLPLRAWRGKEGRGTVLCVGGTPALAGAMVLTGTAALRAGAGRLRIATAAPAAAAVAVAMPEAYVHALDAHHERFALNAAYGLDAAAADAVVLGPGIGDADGCVPFVRTLVEHVRDTPLVLDAGALAVLSSADVLADRRMPAVLTPHCGELARALGCERSDVEARLEEACADAARRFGAVVVLKDSDTVVAHPDGTRYRFTGAVLGLATSGSGDVLAGILGGFLARGAQPLDAALWAVYVHATAGAACQRDVGLGFLARELLTAVPRVLADLDR